jgi:hypothetical protein
MVQVFMFFQKRFAPDYGLAADLAAKHAAAAGTITATPCLSFLAAQTGAAFLHRPRGQGIRAPEGLLADNALLCLLV